MERIIHLFSNRCDSIALIEELKNIDYFLTIPLSYTQTEIDNILKPIKGIKEISLSIIIETSKLKSVTKLILD